MKITTLAFAALVAALLNGCAGAPPVVGRVSASYAGATAALGYDGNRVSTELGLGDLSALFSRRSTELPNRGGFAK